VVDDARFADANILNDRVLDAFIYRTVTSPLRRLGLGEVDTAVVYPGSGDGGVAQVFDLSTLAKYQNIIWSYGSKDANSGLRENETCASG